MSTTTGTEEPSGLDEVNQYRESLSRQENRSSSILSVSNEILTHIFDLARGHTGVIHQFQFFSTLSSGDVKTIKNLRLTCRRFHDMSSHLLLYVVDVDLTRASLTQLDLISHHPLLGKGVKIVRINMAPCYHPLLAGDVQALAGYQAALLRQNLSFWDMYGHFKFDDNDSKSDEYQTAITKALPLAELWEAIAEEGIDSTRTDHMMLFEAHQRYVQLFKEYRRVCASFAPAVSSAISRIPSARSIWFREDSKWLSTLTGGFAPQDLHDSGSIARKLDQPMRWEEMRRFGAESPPFHLVADLLLALQQVGVPLSSLDIATPPPVPLPSFIGTDDPNPLVSATGELQLQEFCFRPSLGICDEDWLRISPTEWTPFTSFLSSILQSKSLTSIELGFHFLNLDDPPPRLSMASLLLSQTWPNLLFLGFSGPFHMEELFTVVKGLRYDAELHWGGYLMSGSWAGVLDFLREHGPAHQTLGDVTASIHGQECDDMDEEPRKFIFDGGFGGESQANHYIRGDVTGNPVRQWEAGELVLPEESDLDSDENGYGDGDADQDDSENGEDDGEDDE
ncbi:hypothetical protein F5Y16DRAFT_303285 [Xylariaceae sp. FL0255]|nr:hypothetical protein F5Y16DRAFT_303285 [Xylariaceae sp. FL0255]